MQQNNTRFNDKYFHLSELGSKLNLSFSSHLVMGNRIIAFDGLKKKLVVAEIKNEVSPTCIIDLDQVKTISMKKTYSSIKPGELNKKGLREFLQTIYLQFEYSNEDKTIVLPFYERKIDRFQDLSRLERNARNWQLILSKMVNTQNYNPVKDKRQLQLAG
jgi:hypothetical protein